VTKKLTVITTVIYSTLLHSFN